MQGQTLATAQLLLQHDQEQLKVGRLPPIEVSRAESLQDRELSGKIWDPCFVRPAPPIRLP